MALVRRSQRDIKSFELSQEQLARLTSLSEQEIQRQAESDPDNPPATDDDLARGALARELRVFRKANGLTQEDFAFKYGIPLATVRDWEQGRRMPEAAAQSYLKVIMNNPRAVENALHGHAA